MVFRPLPTKLRTAVARLLIVAIALSLLTLTSSKTIQAAPSSMTFTTDGNAGYTFLSGVASDDLFRAGDNTVAYCLSAGRAAPAGQNYSLMGELPLRQEIILDLGYPNNTTINGVAFSAVNARHITQFALWLTNTTGYGTTYSPSSMAGNAQGIAAVNYLISASYTPQHRYYGYTLGHSTGYQDMAYSVGDSISGYLRIIKTSSNTAISNNSNYSLDGARYGVYSSIANANANTNRVTTLTLSGATSASATSGALAAGTYYVKELSPAPTGYTLNATVYSAVVSSGSTVTLNVQDAPQPALITLTKSSGNTSITNSNSCYTLAGAVYGIYGSRANANAGTNVLDTLTTAANGRTPNSKSLPANTYYVKEITAPQGYLMDTQIYSATVAPGGTGAITATDQPANNPTSAYVYKVDAVTGKQVPQGAASLAGAQFTVRYYAGYYNTAAAAAQSGTPTRTWVFQTDSNGNVSFNNASYRVSGSTLYTNGSGNPTLPLGTYVYSETKASPGYLLPDSPTVFVTRVVVDPTNTSYGYKLEGNLFGSQSQVGNSTTVQKEQVVGGDIELIKTYDVGRPVVQNPLANVSFAITSKTTSKVYTITTDADGYASTRSLVPTSAQLPGATYGALPYDTYTVHEVASTVPAGLNCVDDFQVTISVDRQYTKFNLNDTKVTAAVQILKQDATTGKVIPLAGTAFQILESNGVPYIMTQHTPEEVTSDTWYTDDDGTLMLPELIDYGNYFLHEVIAPKGYLLSDDIPFAVSKNMPFTNPIIIVNADVPQMGVINIIKHDSVSGETLGGATYGIYAAEDIITADGTTRAYKGDLVDTVVTTTTAAAPSKPLFLGRYTVHELAAPVGYLVDEADYPISLDYDTSVETVQADLKVKDDYTKVEIDKKDSASGKGIEGAEFTLYQAHPVAGSSTPDWEEVQKLETDAKGKIDFIKLAFGDYKVIETRPNPHYATPEESGMPIEHFFTVDTTTQGTQGNHLLQVLPLTNDEIRTSCEVDKHTIDRTSAAYVALPGEEGTNNTATGSEELYRYDVDFRSTSNFRADEFVVDDPLEGVAKNQIRVKELWTPIVYGDSDGYFNLWYKTNKTNDAKSYSNVMALSTNPANPNNPGNKQDWPNNGFKLWSEDVTSTARIHFDVSDLHLASGEYLTAIRLEYGSVEKGFTSSNTTTKGGENWTPNSARADFAQGAAAATGLEPLTYMVYCPDPLPVSTEETEAVPVKRTNGSIKTEQSAISTDTVIYGSVTVHIARNLILTDEDETKVETRVIGTFAPVPQHPLPTGYSKLSGLPVPVTSLGNVGDIAHPFPWIILFLIVLTVAGFAYRRISIPEHTGATNGKLENWHGFSRPDTRTPEITASEKRTRRLK